MTIRNKLFLSTLATASVMLSASPSHALVLNTIDPTGFNYSYAGGGIAAPAVPTSPAGIGTTAGTLNTSTTDGFSNFFADPSVGKSVPGYDPSIFGRLGNRDNSGIVANPNTFQSSNAQSGPLTLSPADAAGTLYIKFAYIFAGSNPGGGSSILGTIFNGNSFTNEYTFLSTNVLGATPFTEFFIPAGTLSAAVGAGDPLFINLQFQENNPTRTAFGFSVIQVDSVPFEFSPGLGLLSVGAFFGAVQLRKKLRNRNVTSLKSVDEQS